MSYYRGAPSASGPEYFLMTIVEHERIVGHNWSKPDGSPLKNNITVINATIMAENVLSGMIGVTYTFSNDKKCKDALAQSEQGHL
jgi:hypothetical protein